MTNINTLYLNLQATPVKNLVDFIGRDLPEISKIKSLLSSIKSVFKSSDSNIQLYFIEVRVYIIDVFSNRWKLNLISSIYYLPNINQIHMYDNLGNIMIASEKKRLILDNISYTLSYLGVIDKLKSIIVSV